MERLPSVLGDAKRSPTEIRMTTPPDDRTTLRISIGACMVLTAAIASVLASYEYYGLAGAAFDFAGIACVWFALSRTSISSLLPINARRLTITELLTLLGLCAILYGFSLPAVSFIPRGQPPAPIPTTNTVTHYGVEPANAPKYSKTSFHDGGVSARTR